MADLEQIVQRMVEAGESEADIALVIREYKPAAAGKPPMVMVNDWPMSFEEFNQTQQTPDPTAPVKVSDFATDPQGAKRRMVDEAFRDPRYFPGMMPSGPTAVGGAVQSAAAKAPGLLTRIGQNVKLDDVVEAIPGGGNVKAGYRVLRDVAGAVRSKPPSTPPPPPGAAPAPVATPGAPVGPPTAMSARPTPPVAPAPPPVPTLSEEALRAARTGRAGEDAAMLTRYQESIRAGQPAPAAQPMKRAPGLRTQSQPAAPPKAKAPKKAKASPAASTAASSVDDLQLTPAELAQGVKWQAQGVAPQVILERILQSRQLTAATRTHSPDIAAEAVRIRNTTGRWPQE